MKTKAKPTARKRAICPDCGAPVTVQRPRLGDNITCPECESDLLVVQLTPLTLDWEFDDEDEDFDFDFDDEDDADDDF